MVLCSGRHPFNRHEEGPQLGPWCGTCWVTVALPPQGPLWGARCSPSCCWDPPEGCAGLALPYPCHHAWPSAPAHSMESLSSAASSTADSSPSAGSPPAPRCPGEEEALSTALALCRVSASSSTAIDRRSFIATGLAAELLEELLSQRLPAPQPEQDDGSPEERCCARVTASPSLERLRRHNQAFQRAMESFQEPAWAPVEAPVCPGQRRHQAQPCGHLCCHRTWHMAHGCCAHVEPVTGTWHQRGPNPGPAAPTRSETSCTRQRHRHRGCTRDTHLAPGTGTVVSHEPRQCRRGTRAVAREGREPPWEPELSRQPHGQEGLAVSLQCRDGEPEPGPSCGCGCVLALKSHAQAMGWMQQEREAPVPGSCFREPRAAGATNMVQVIARTFELRAQHDSCAPPAVPVPALTLRAKARARHGARHGARS
ncbi:uncharacterized protein PRD47_008654 [Ara ararauna]